MLYRPGTILAYNAAVVEADTDSDLLDGIVDDTEEILTDDTWEEVLTLKRGSVTYDDVGLSSITWTTLGTFLGDYQPVTGVTFREEKGLKVKSDARIICSTSCQATENDKVIRSDDTEYYVNYVRKYEDHYTLYLIRVKGSE